MMFLLILIELGFGGIVLVFLTTLGGGENDLDVVVRFNDMGDEGSGRSPSPIVLFILYG